MPHAEPFRGQTYRALKKQLRAEGKLFTDPEFPPADTSLFFKPKEPSGIEWKRPGEIVENPQLFVEGLGSDDVTQGILGNCWFVAACSALTHTKDLWQKVIPDAKEQEWDKHNPEDYCGIFHFCFWQFGHWVDVVIDDMLPVHEGQLLFAKSKTRNEFWSALLEKAFAKLSGCYDALIGGSLAEAFVDITGGVPESLDLTTGIRDDLQRRIGLFYELQEAFHCGSLMAAAIAAKDKSEVEEALPCGLVKGHAYSVTAVRKISLDASLGKLDIFKTAESVLMIRLRNPWGEKEWNGPWSDGAPEWEKISKKQQNELGLKLEEDGEFWMTFDDFSSYFTDVSVCHLINTSFFSVSHTRYTENVFHSMWRSDHSKGHFSNRAGGCINFRETFLCNPQFRFDISEEQTYPVMISLMQRDVRERRKQGARFITIGIHVMKVEENRKYRLHQIMKGVGTSDYVNSRSVFLRLNNLKRGRYIIVPTTYAPGDEGEFLLRIYSHSGINAEELTLDKPVPGVCKQCCSSEPQCVTRVNVVSAQDLGKQDRMGGADPYCVISCEGQKSKTLSVKNTLNPTWDCSFLFLRRYPDKPITFEVMNDNVIKDQVMGQATVEAPITNDSKRYELSLTTKKKLAEGKSARLIVEITTFDDPLFL